MCANATDSVLIWTKHSNFLRAYCFKFCLPNSQNYHHISQFIGFAVTCHQSRWNLKTVSKPAVHNTMSCYIQSPTAANCLVISPNWTCIYSRVNRDNKTRLRLRSSLSISLLLSHTHTPTHIHVHVCNNTRIYAHDWSMYVIICMPEVCVRSYIDVFVLSSFMGRVLLGDQHSSQLLNMVNGQSWEAQRGPRTCYQTRFRLMSS